VTTSDHRPVYLDLQLVPLIDEAVSDIQVTYDEGEVNLSWQVQEEVSYRLEKCLDLASNSWEAVDGISIDIAEGRAEALLPSASSKQFFRIVAFYEPAD